MRLICSILVVLFVVSVLCLWSVYNRAHEKVQTLERECAKCQSELSIKIYDNCKLNEIFETFIKNEGLYIDLGEMVAKKYRRKNISIEDENRYLIIRLNQNHCQTCINVLMSKLQSYLTSENVLFLVSYENEDFLREIKSYQIEATYLKENEILIPADSIELPYLFVWNNREKVVDRFFIPTTYNIEQIGIYLERISTLLKK